MAHVQSRSMSLWATAAAVAMLAGCVTTDGTLVQVESMTPKKGKIACSVTASWQNRVMYTPDPANNGRLSPGLAGRIHLWDEEVKFPLPGDGGIVVELFDETTGQLQFLDRWEIDPSTFARLLKRDVLGWGYTVYLPWVRNYRADISKVCLRVRYQPGTAKSGSPLFCESHLSLAVQNGQVNVQNVPTPVR